MDAFEHVSFCKNVAWRVYREFKEIGINICPVLGMYYLDGEKVVSYMHPDDKYKEHKELKYPYGDI